MRKPSRQWNMLTPGREGDDAGRQWEDRIGRVHRKHGPALETNNGNKTWCWHGTAIYEEFRNQAGDGFHVPGDTSCVFVCANWEFDWYWGRNWKVRGGWHSTEEKGDGN